LKEDYYKMIKISVVSYLNSKPFIYGFDAVNFGSKANISLDIPSVCAQKLLTGVADIGLIPVAVLPEMKDYHIISDYCIGADGPVDSVLLLSDVPLEQIETVLLDYQSRTSVMLTRVLAKNFWNINPVFTPAQPEYENRIGGDVAGVVIGDRALKLKSKFKFCYDLSGEWKKFTGMPFVFATWTSRIKPDDNFIQEFNAAIEAGMKLIPTIAKSECNESMKESDILSYLTKSIDFKFDDRKKEALQLFLKYIKEIDLVEN
jgi:chorismate dehydratase